MCPKSIETEAVFTETEMKQSFFLKYEVCSKSIKTEAVFIMTEMNNEGTIYQPLRSGRI